MEAFKIEAPLNRQDPIVEPIRLNSVQKKEGEEILGLKDGNRLYTFSKNFGAFPTVIGMPVTEEEWPGFMGGGIKGFFSGGLPGIFDNLQWADRLYFSLTMKVPPPAPFLSEGNTAASSPVSTVNFSVASSPTKTNPVPTPSVVRVEILNGCGITNAADWVARRMKGPGIIVSDTGNADNFHYSKTIVRTTAGIPIALEEAAGRLGLSKDSIEEISIPTSSVDAIVIVGKDFPKLKENLHDRDRH